MLKVQNVIKFYGKKSMFRDKRIPVVKGVSFDCPTGASVAIIGESGSGKSTLSRMILGLEKPDQGQVTLDGQPVHLKKVRRHRIAAVFQDYTSSLHPFHTVKDILFEVMYCYPHMLSGGEAQRVAIARAICMQPDYILFDEAISSLDMSMQTQILDLLKRLRHSHQLSYIFITHDIQAATYICDDLLIFKNGCIEARTSISELHRQQNGYTRELIDKQLSI
ncbi:MAG: ATP-binding cassette domain-containing protein [Staphylococcus epidermidis]|nr:ATP-binding cassette domain-containing protein [Staphylococcus epidermidis]